jgi:hypothetical protein
VSLVGGLVLAGADIGDDSATGDVQRREQVDGAVVLIVMRRSLRCAGQQAADDLGLNPGGALVRALTVVAIFFRS